jgi:ribosome modulation factor
MTVNDIARANAYQAYMRGWKNGACVNAMDERFMARVKDDPVRQQYEAGYEAGYAARNVAASTATARTGHHPSVLRTQGDVDQ